MSRNLTAGFIANLEQPEHRPVGGDDSAIPKVLIWSLAHVDKSIDQISNQSECLI